MHAPGNVIGWGVHAPCMRGQHTRTDRVCSMDRARCILPPIRCAGSEILVVCCVGQYFFYLRIVVTPERGVWQRDQSGRDATASTTGSVPIPRLARALALRARCPAGLYPPPPFPHCPPFTSHHPHAPGWIWLLRMASRVTVEDLRSLLSSRGLPTRGNASRRRRW